MLHFLRVALYPLALFRVPFFRCCIQVSHFLSCTFFVLYSFHREICLCCNIFELYLVSFTFFSCSPLFMLHFFHVTYIQVRLFSFQTLLLLPALHIAHFSCCAFFSLHFSLCTYPRNTHFFLLLHFTHASLFSRCRLSWQSSMLHLYEVAIF